MKPFISMRLSVDQQLDYDNLSEFIKLFKRNPGSCEEIWFSTYYGYPKREKHAHMAGLLLDCAKLARENEISVSLQISNTIGHGSLHGTTDISGFKWDPFVGYDGTESVKCGCPRDNKFLKYIKDTTGYYAKIKPDWVWIDDDIRMNNHVPANHGCFCSRCIKEFNAEHGTDYDRERMVSAVNDDISIREKFIRFNQRSLEGIVRAVWEAVEPISPESSIGIQMTTYPSTTYNGDSWDYIMGRIKELTGKPAAIRPGGGFYNDHEPRGVLTKGLKLSSATQRKSDEMTISQAEIENIPHTFSGKSVKGTLVESAVYLAYGCTSLSYSAFMSQNEKTGYYEKLLKGLSDWGGFLRNYQKLNIGTINDGAGIVFSKTHNKKAGSVKAPFDWCGFKGDDIFNMQEFGLPLTWYSYASNAALLHYSEVDALSEDEIIEIFSKGVITDSATILKLNNRGLGHILNMETKEFDVLDCCEKATEHPFNSGHEGQVWHNYYTQASMPQPMLLYPKHQSAEVLGEFIRRYDKKVKRGISTVKQETSFGGRAVVFSYNPWTGLVNSTRRQQLLECLDWVSGGQVLAMMKTAAQAVLIPRVDKKGSLISTMVINIGLDDIDAMEIYINSGDRSSFEWIQPERRPVPLHAKSTDKGKLVRLPLMKSWELGYIK